MLKSAIPGVDTVTNLRPAFGGVDPESLESARNRAAIEIRTRYRAVTPDDFEFLCGEASPRVARAVCLPPGEDGMVRVHILPMVAPADRQLTVEELSPDEALLTEVAEYLDERQVIGMSLELLPVKLHGVSVVVNLQASNNADLERVEQDVAYALYTYLNPLVGGSTDGLGDGWEFGRSLNQGELYGIVRKIEGVEFIKILRVYETDLATGKQDPKPAGSYLEIGEDELIASGTHIVKAERAEILSPSTVHGTSLAHGATTRRGFSTTNLRARLSSTEAPAVVSRARLPAQQHAQRLPGRRLRPPLPGSLETTLDPIVGTLDVLSRYFHSDARPARRARPARLVGRAAGRRGLARRPAARGARPRERDRRGGAGRRQGSTLALEIAFPKISAPGRGRRRGHLVDEPRTRRRRLPRRALWSTATHRSPKRPSSRSAG